MNLSLKLLDIFRRQVRRTSLLLAGVAILNKGELHINMNQDKNEQANELFKDYPDIITIIDLQAVLHIGRNAAYKLLQDNSMVSIRVGKKYIIPKSSVPRYKSEYLNPAQVGEVLDLFAGNTAELPVTLCALYGLRRSDAIGLQWKNIDLQQRLITVASTMQQGSGGCYLAEPKTESSYRTLPMMDMIYAILSKQKERQERNKALLGQGYIESDFVCTWDDGRLITPDYVTREFHKVISKSDLPTIRLHDLRHCVASNLLNSGYSPTNVAAWLGHSSPNTTFGYYAHASKASKENISNAVQGWFNPNSLDNC